MVEREEGREEERKGREGGEKRKDRAEGRNLSAHLTDYSKPWTFRGLKRKQRTEELGQLLTVVHLQDALGTRPCCSQSGRGEEENSKAVKPWKDPEQVSRQACPQCRDVDPHSSNACRGLSGQLQVHRQLPTRELHHRSGDGFNRLPLRVGLRD